MIIMCHVECSRALDNVVDPGTVYRKNLFDYPMTVVGSGRLIPFDRFSK